MSDVARALILPDVLAPSDHLLKTLILYWDQLVIPDYVERAGGTEKIPSGLVEPSEIFSTLESNGVVERAPRMVDLPPVDRADLPSELQQEPFPPEAPGAPRLLACIAPLLEFLSQRKENAEVDELTDDPEFAHAVRESIKRQLDYAAKHYVRRVLDSFEYAEQGNLAPLARSPLSHVASMLGSEKAPLAEAALLSATIQSFELDTSTPLERILKFREKNDYLLGRFRGSLVDLSEGLKADQDPNRLLAEAHDRYRNRVVPALGDLEYALKSSKIQFFLRSLFGATALTLGPIAPVNAATQGVNFTGQTINYAFSREKLVRDHPFGYLYRISTDLSTQPGQSPNRFAEIVEDPEAKAQQLFLQQARSDQLMEFMREFWYPPKVREEIAEELANPSISDTEGN